MRLQDQQPRTIAAALAAVGALDDAIGYTTAAMAFQYQRCEGSATFRGEVAGIVNRVDDRSATLASVTEARAALAAVGWIPIVQPGVDDGVQGKESTGFNLMMYQGDLSVRMGFRPGDGESLLAISGPCVAVGDERELDFAFFSFFGVDQLFRVEGADVPSTAPLEERSSRSFTDVDVLERHRVAATAALVEAMSGLVASNVQVDAVARYDQCWAATSESDATYEAVAEATLDPTLPGVDIVELITAAGWQPDGVNNSDTGHNQFRRGDLHLVVQDVPALRLTVSGPCSQAAEHNVSSLELFVPLDLAPIFADR